MNLKDRIKRLQRKLGLEDDGIIGVDTVSALERALGIVETAGESAVAPFASRGAMALSRKGIDELVADEISSASYYEQRLAAPTWPGGASGATIGIGYDLGYRTKTAIRSDWSSHLSEQMISHLTSAAGIKGQAAQGVARSLKQAGVRVPLEAANRVFYTVTIPEFAALTRRTYPGVETLPPDAQAALLSLVYNRGASLEGARRREMANIRTQVKKRDLEAIARELESMKRLWVGQGLNGLLRRRDREARLVRESERTYTPDELIFA
jgi:hypothetical protein